MEKRNDLNKLKQEFLELGLELGLIDKQKKSDVEYRLSRIGIDTDDTIPSAYVALTRLDDDIYTICINSKDSIYADEMLIDELVFAEIAHIVNDIHQDLYVYSRSELQSFIEEQRKKYGYPTSEENLTTDLKPSEQGNLHSWPVQGPTLLEECICQYISNIMVGKKYDTELNGKNYAVTGPLIPRYFVCDENSDYSLKLRAADIFSKTLYSGEDSMKKMCKDSLSDYFLDKMFAKYKTREGGEQTLFEIFSFMGTYNTVLLTKKNFVDGPSQLTGRNYDDNHNKIVSEDTEEKAKRILFSRLEKELKEN